MHRVNQRERLIPMNIYRKEIARARLGDNIANHMGFIFALALYDKFDLAEEKAKYETVVVKKEGAAGGTASAEEKADPVTTAEEQGSLSDGRDHPESVH